MRTLTTAILLPVNAISQGKNLDRASQEADVHVRIGTSFCNVTSLSRSQLTCRPPSVQPAALSADNRPNHNDIPQVIVQIGENLNYTIGRLSYEQPPRPGDANLPKPVLIAVIVGSCILIVIVIIILIAYRRKSTESSRVLKSMQEQMDVLELRVASECKEASVHSRRNLLISLHGPLHHFLFMRMCAEPGT